MNADEIKAVIATLSVDLDRAESVLGLAHNEDEPARKIYHLLRFYSALVQMTAVVREFDKWLDPKMDLFGLELSEQQKIDWIRERLRGDS